MSAVRAPDVITPDALSTRSGNVLVATADRVSPLILPVALVTGYEFWARWAGNLYFPRIGEIGSEFRRLWFGAGFTADVVPSLVNLTLGYGFGVAVGLLLGIALGQVDSLFRALSPVVAFTLTLPPVALLPLFVTVLGVGRSMQIGVIVFGVVFLVAVTTAHALRGIDPVLRDMTVTFAIRGPRLLGQVLLPAIAPQLLGALRAALSVAVLIMAVSELVGASHGIGAVTLLAQQSFQYAQMWAGMVLLAVLGTGLNGVFTLAERPVLRRAGLDHPVRPGRGTP